MPYKGADTDQENLIEFARGGRPNLDDTDTFGGPRPTAVREQGRLDSNVNFQNITPLKPKVELSEKDEILEVLDELAADIRSGKVTPSHLILGFGEDLDNNGFAYSWDAIGLNRFEVMGFLQVYQAMLANGETE